MPDGRFFVMALLAAAAVVVSAIWPPMIEQWRGMIEQAAVRRSIDPALIAAIIWTESGGMPDAVRHEPSFGVSSYGLMQIASFDWRPVPELLLDPAFNVEFGARMLAQIIGLADGDMRLALAAYNCGFEGVRVNRCGKWGGYVYADKVLVKCAEFGGACLGKYRDEDWSLECENLPTANLSFGSHFC